MIVLDEEVSSESDDEKEENEETPEYLEYLQSLAPKNWKVSTFKCCSTEALISEFFDSKLKNVHVSIGSRSL